MEERKWENLETDCLLNILGRVGMESLLFDVPFVCKSWYKASLDPLCWKSLGFPRAFDSFSCKAFMERFKNEYRIEKLSETKFIKFIVDRSCGIATTLVFPSYCTEEALKYAADKCPALEILGFPFDLCNYLLSILSELLIVKWKNLEGLILGIDSHLRHHSVGIRDVAANIRKEEISTIVTLLPKIKYLNISWALIDRESLVIILKGCKELVYLDISNCESFEVDNEILELASHITTFKYEGSRLRHPMFLDMVLPSYVPDDPSLHGYNNFLEMIFDEDYD